MHLVYVYNGPGASDVQDYVVALKRVLDVDYKVELVDSAEPLLKHADRVRLWVMPGGADRFYLEHLKGQGNEALVQFVKNGGCYLGICAGAYYAASCILFDLNTPNEIQGERPLKLFEGIAQGPVLRPYFYNEPKGITCGKIFLSEHVFSDKAELNRPSSHFSYLYYNGGPCFLPESATCEILAWYQKEAQESWYLSTNATKLPAIVYKKFGQGHVVLSGLHLENSLFDSYNTLNNCLSNMDLLTYCLGAKMGLSCKHSIHCSL